MAREISSEWATFMIMGRRGGGGGEREREKKRKKRKNDKERPKERKKIPLQPYFGCHFRAHLSSCAPTVII